MKNILLIAASLISFQAAAFTTITLKTEAELAPNEMIHSLYFSTTEGKGNDYCTLSLTSPGNQGLLTVPAGTKFEVVSIEQNACDQDWGKQCRLDLTARNQQKNVKLDLICKDKGFFAKELTPAKVNKIIKNTILVN